MHVAALQGNHEILRMLLRAGADPNQKTVKGWGFSGPADLPLTTQKRLVKTATGYRTRAVLLVLHKNGI